MSRVIFEPKLAAEVKRYDFPFTLPLGVTISSAAVTAAAYSGADASPQDIVSGSATTSDATVTQAIAGGTAGVLYDLTCTATLSDGQVLETSGFIAIIPSA